MLKDTLLKSGAIKTGEFVLTSGKKSNYYVDIKEAATDPAVLKEISAELSKNIKARKIAGMELGAVPILVSTAIRLSIPYVILRKEITHGTKKLTVGKINEGETIDMIEDVVTTGHSLLRAIDLVRNNGGVVKRAICVVDRLDGGAELLMENGVQLIPLVKISEIPIIS
ncbi:MAG: orotate phosphoribosyltransferase [Thermoplasmataceae archaeon]